VFFEQVEFNLRKHENQGRSIFRVCNISAARYLGGDIVCLVPPSFTDQRKDRARVKASLFASSTALSELAADRCDPDP